MPKCCNTKYFLRTALTIMKPRLYLGLDNVSRPRGLREFESLLRNNFRVVNLFEISFCALLKLTDECLFMMHALDYDY